MLSGCAADGDEPSVDPGVRCSAPTAMQVQVAHEPGAEDLVITSGGIGAPSLSSPGPGEGDAEVAEDASPQELPPGVHARIVDLETGETVRSETLRGGVARTEALEEGEYRVGLVSVAEDGRIDGIATAELRLDDEDHLVTLPEVAQQRELPISALEVSDGAVELQVSPAGEGSSRTQWRLEGPQDQQSGAAQDGAARIEGLDDGPHTLMVVAEAEQAPGIVEQAVRCGFTVADGDAQPTSGGTGDDAGA